MFQFTLWTLLPAATVLFAVVAFLRSDHHDHVPGSTAIRFLFVCIIAWAAPQALETMVTSEAAKLLATQVSYVGITLTPVAWFQFAITYSQGVVDMNRRVLNLICMIPVITLGLVFSNDLHQLFWTSWQVVDYKGYAGLVVEHGPAFYVNAMYGYTMIIAATSILGFALTHTGKHYQVLLAVIAAPLTAMVVNILSISSYNPYPFLDFTTLGFLFGVIILNRGILKPGLLDRLPVARDQVVELLKDPVLVIDSNGLVVDANQSALHAWGDVAQSSIETIVEHLPLSHLLQRPKNHEVTITDRTYEVSTTRLDENNPRSDVALLFRDVTERRKAERKLRDMTDRLDRMAHTDALTNLFNRRYFMQRLSEEFERVKRHPGHLSVLIFDLDHFKRVNDNLGHDAGDAVLVAVANVANQIKRVTDVACRLGGEEFALLLPETDKDGALKMAQRLREGIESYPYGELLDLHVLVTASVGVATISEVGEHPEDILKVADRALYDAKEGGRNKVCFQAA